MAYFPMFVQLKKKKCLVIGGGKIALRKIEVLKDFEADRTRDDNTDSADRSDVPNLSNVYGERF